AGLVARPGGGRIVLGSRPRIVSPPVPVQAAGPAGISQAPLRTRDTGLSTPPAPGRLDGRPGAPSDLGRTGANTGSPAGRPSAMTRPSAAAPRAARGPAGIRPPQADTRRSPAGTRPTPASTRATPASTRPFPAGPWPSGHPVATRPAAGLAVV